MALASKQDSTEIKVHKHWEISNLDNEKCKSNASKFRVRQPKNVEILTSKETKWDSETQLRNTTTETSRYSSSKAPADSTWSIAWTSPVHPKIRHAEISITQMKKSLLYNSYALNPLRLSNWNNQLDDSRRQWRRRPRSRSAKYLANRGCGKANPFGVKPKLFLGKQTEQARRKKDTRGGERGELQAKLAGRFLLDWRSRRQIVLDVGAIQVQFGARGFESPSGSHF